MNQIWVVKYSGKLFHVCFMREIFVYVAHPEVIIADINWNIKHVPIALAHA